MNKMFKNVMRLVLAAVLLTSSTQALAARLDLSQGTMSLDAKGVVGVKDITGTKPAWSYNLEFGAGYFVLDNFAVGAGVGVGSLNLTNAGVQMFALQAGMGYFFDIKTIVTPYLAVDFQAKNTMVPKGGSAQPTTTEGTGGAAESTTLWRYSAIPKVGLLVALSSSVALDLALRGTIGFDGQIDVDGGVVGVKAFF